MKGAGWLRWLVLALGIAITTHVATVWLLPRVVMRVAAQGMAEASGQGFNHAVFPPRADENARSIVRPSPDLIYAACAFDLSDGPLRIRATVPRDTYWSLSMFAGNTDNFFVVNDRGAASGELDLVLAPAGADVVPPAGATLVESPTARGIVLTRTLIASEERLAELDEARRRFSCVPLS